MTTKTGYDKLMTIVRSEKARGANGIGIARIMNYTGLTRKSIAMYASWYVIGNFKNEMLVLV